MVAILVKWPKTNIMFLLFYLPNPYEIWVQTAQWFLRNQSKMSGLGWKVKLTFGAYIKPVSHSVKHFSQVLWFPLIQL